MWSLATSTAAATCLNCDLEPAIQPAVRVMSNHRHSSAGQSSHVKHRGEVEQLVYHTELLHLCRTTGLPHNLCVEQLVYHTNFVLICWFITLSVCLCVEQLVADATIVEVSLAHADVSPSLINLQTEDQTETSSQFRQRPLTASILLGSQHRRCPLLR